MSGFESDGRFEVGPYVLFPRGEELQPLLMLVDLNGCLPEASSCKLLGRNGDRTQSL